MYQFIKHHFFQYLLILLLFAVTVTTLVSSIQRAQKILVVGLTLTVYFFWAIWHHWEDHELKTSTVLEYLVLTLFFFWLLINLAV